MRGRWETSERSEKNKGVCGCCYLKGGDKVSVTDSVRSSRRVERDRIREEADMAARLHEVRLMG